MAVACKDCASCPKKQEKHEVEIQIEDLEYDFTTNINDPTTIAERRYPLKQAKIRIRSITPPRCRDRKSSSASPTSSNGMHNPVQQTGAGDVNKDQSLTPGGQHHLWVPEDHPLKRVEPQYHLKLDVIKDNEWRGDCPTRKFAFKSLHHLTYAINRLEADFKDLPIRKCGVDGPDAMGGRVNDGTCENVTIEFKETPTMGWKDFLATLRTLESEWEEIL